MKDDSRILDIWGDWERGVRSWTKCLRGKIQVESAESGSAIAHVYEEIPNGEWKHSCSLEPGSRFVAILPGISLRFEVPKEEFLGAHFKRGVWYLSFRNAHLTIRAG